MIIEILAFSFFGLMHVGLIAGLNQNKIKKIKHFVKNSRINNIIKNVATGKPNKK